jgi:menaquinone-dependent protoporphyrinogen oxidase
MSRFLVAYASSHGQTATIARRIVETLRAEGHRVELRDDLCRSGPDPAAYDAVVVGSSIHRGHYGPDLVDWLRQRHVALNTMPSAFFSVCLAVLEDRDAARTYIDELEEDTDWTPRYRTTFAGALRYPAYDFATRLLMRVLMRRGGHPTDIRREYEYTDWDAVDAFARDCAKLPEHVGLLA